MHAAPRSTAQMVSGLSLAGGGGWTAALAVRDGLRLPWSPDIPALEPAVLAIPSLGPAVEEREWFSWLRQIADAPRTAAVPHGSTALRAALTSIRPVLREHEEIWDRHVAELAESLRDVVGVAGGGRLTYLIQIVPVAREWVLDVSAAHLLASPGALATAAARRSLLEPRLRRATLDR